jgi:MipA family protein
MKFLSAALLLALPFAATSQTPGPDDPIPEEQGPLQGAPAWSLGLAAVVNDSPYAGAGARVMPIPLFGYEGEHFFFRGLSFGWRFVGNDSLELAAVAKGKFEGFKVKDLGRRELAANGIDYRQLEDRDNGLDLGLSAMWKGAFGELETAILADATDASGGQEATLQYSYGFEVGKGQLRPNVSARWLSGGAANYYYGTLDSEVARGMVDYKPGSLVMPSLGVAYLRPLGVRWALMGFANYNLLPDEITESPLVEANTDDSFSVVLGFSRGF